MSNVLEGYSYAEWPNLSGDRSPNPCTHVASKAITVSGDENSKAEDVSTSVILLAVSRVIGAYCGVADVLLAIQIGQHGSINFIRIAWGEEDNWAELKLKVDQAIRDALERPISLNVARKALSLDDNQYPYLALCMFDQSDRPQDTQHPPVISYSNLDSVLHFSASMATVHPTASTLFLSQVVDLIHQGSKYPTSRFSSTDSLPSELTSVFERGTFDDVGAAYSHISAVTFASDYLLERVKDMPHATAVRWYPELALEAEQLHYESISYIDLDKKSSQVARWLLRMGLQREDRIAVCLDRNLHFHVAMMGIMKAGGCYVPIDPELPLERKIYIAQDANAVFVLTSADIASSDVFGPLTLYIEDEACQDEIAHESSEPISLMDLNGLAYMLYTSGTTGNPKGCLLTHHGLSQAILALSSTAADVRMDNIHEGRYLAVASIAFDVHLGETIVPIALGMPLLSARRSQLLENLPVYVNKLGVTHLGIVPSLIEATLNAAQSGISGLDVGLRYIASGGEKMSDSILDKWADHPQVRLANFYGPSEVTIGCCARYMTSKTPKANIGKPFTNVSGYVVDARMNILLRGGVGELVVEGPLVGRGYHGRPDLTEKVFLEWPRNGCWAYRTGDLVRMMPDCTIEILGRIDTQIKLRGVRIESEGISAIVRKAVPSTDTITFDATTVLAKHPAINVDQLVSFFTWDGSISISTRKSQKPHLTTPPPDFLQKIKAKCESELPGYMRPSHFIPLSWLPLSSNGKTDTKILTELFKKLHVEEIARLSVSQDDSQEPCPCSDVELKVFGVLQNHVAMVFDKPHPKINIFECGLDSMGVIKFTTELKDVFRTKVAATQVMKAPRIVDIASYLTTEINTPKIQISPSFEIPALDEIYSLYRSSRIEDVLPPFTVQEGVLSRSADIDTLYVQHVLVSCRPDISLCVLQTAWKNVVDRNQILRTVFHFGRTLSQVVLSPTTCSVNWKQNEISSQHNGQNFPGFFMSLEASSISKAINQNISAIPPYQLSVYSSTENTYLVLSIQHALFDGISLPRLFEQVEREYFGVACRPQASVSGILHHICTIDPDLAKTFWEKYFIGYRWPQSTLYPGSPTSTQRLTLPFKAPLLFVKELATSQSVTMQALFTCAFAHLLASKVYKQKDVVFGVIRSGRLLPIDHIDESICPLVSILPVRINFGAPQISLQGIQEGISSTMEYEHLPLGKVQGWVRPGKPVFEVLFSVSVNDQPQSKLWNIIESEPPEADYPLAVEIVINPSLNYIELKAAWMNKDSSDSPVNWLQDFEDVVSSLAGNTGSYLSQSLDGIPHSSSPENNFDCLQKISPSNEDNSCLDPALIGILRSVIADFMGFGPTILTPSISLVSLGLDSIKSVGLAKAIAKQGYPVTSTDILRNSTLNDLASCIKAKGSREGGRPTQLIPDLSSATPSEITPDSVRLADEDVIFLPTTALQTGMLSQTVNSKGQLYIHAFPLRIPGIVDVERMHNAWIKAVQLFAILRTSFHFSTESGVWIQAVHSSGPLDWAVTPLARVEDYRLELKSFVASIDLKDETCFGRPPLWVRLFTSTMDGGKEPTSFLIFAMHHCLYDGISVGKLILSVQDLYAGSSTRIAHQFHELLPHFLHQEKEGTSFWLNRVRRFKPTTLRRLRQTSLSSPSAMLERSISLDCDRVREILSQASVTMQCLCQAAWAKVLSNYTGSPDVVFGHTVSGRSIPGAEDVIGPVLNTIPCCIRLEAGTENIGLLRSIHQSNLDALPWQQASPRAIQKAMGVESLWDSLFLFQASEPENTRTNSWTFDKDALIDEVKIQYPLNVEITHHGLGVAIKCASHPDYIDQTELGVVIEDFQESIRHILREPHGMVFHDIARSPNAKTLSSNGPSQNVPKEKINPHTSEVSFSFASHTIDSFAYQPILMALTNAPISLMKPETPLVALGVDSIMAIQIVGKFRQNGMKIVASDVITSRTIGDMLEKVSAIEDTPKRRSTTRFTITDAEKTNVYSQFGNEAKEIEAISVVSSGMKWLIGAWQKSLGTRYQHVFAYQLPQNVDVPRMKDAWLSLVQRHPILRSTFTCPKNHSEPRLVTFKSVNEPWVEESVKDEIFFKSILSRMKSMVSNPPSTASPPSRGLLFHSTRNFYLILHLHHFQYDAWSLQLLIHELSSLYRGLKPTTSNNMQAFLDYYSPNPQHLEQQEKYWKTYFPTDFKPILFPPFNSKVDNSRHPTRRLIRINAACITDASQCEKRARFLGLSLQSVFLACWAILQGRITASPSSTFGLWHSGRTGALDDVANLSVPCMNVLPIYVPGVDERNILQIAKWIQTHLPERTSVVEQSDQVLVNEWVGLAGKPMCNVFVNIVKVAPDTGTREPILEPVDAPYFVPDQIKQDEGTCTDDLAITKILNDDIFIDIATLTHTDSIMISIDAAPWMLDEKQADVLISRWSDSVKDCLFLL